MTNGGLAGALTALYARVPLGMRLGLGPMQAACERAANPEGSFAAVHVAGTNGKGSTSAMVEAIARATQVRTGLYTSPHLCRFAERIRIDGVPIDDGDLTAVLNEALAIGPDLSFFETATLAALLAFRAAKVDLAVIEVGIGGRLDATNVIPPPRCAAITRVALDHQDKLGDTLDAIAREKAAIAKSGVPLVVGQMPPEAESAVIEVATAARARIVLAPKLPPGVAVGLLGEHQRQNAAVAWAVAAELRIPEGPREKGLATAQWPGRLERIEIASGELAGSWLLDGAHNPDGAAALALALLREPPSAIVFGALKEKAWPEMLHALRPIAAHRFYVAPSGRAPADPGDLVGLVPGTACASLEEALVAARRHAQERLVAVCGSLYLVGQARARLLDLACDPVVAL